MASVTLVLPLKLLAAVVARSTWSSLLYRGVAAPVAPPIQVACVPLPPWTSGCWP